MTELWLGWAWCAVACLCFGSTFLPAKMVDIRDGWYFTLWLSLGILAVGGFQWMLKGCYLFEPFAMLGGVIWATGNVMVPFIIRRCGLGVGQLVWGTTNMLVGWAAGAFGLLGKQKDVIPNMGLNYVGVVLAVVVLSLFSMMRPEDGAKGDTDNDKGGAAKRPAAAARTAGGFTFGCTVAMVAGVFFGLTFNPPTYLQQLGQADLAEGRTPRHSPHATDYVFSHFCGIFATTAVYFSLAEVYARTRNKSVYMGSDMILPGLASGLMWAVAQVSWFTANSVLSFVVAFPIIVTVPGAIATLLGVMVFNENRGARNRTILLTAVVVKIAAVVFIAISRGSGRAVDL